MLMIIIIIIIITIIIIIIIIMIMIMNTFLERWIPLLATNLRLKALYMFN